MSDHVFVNRTLNMKHIKWIGLDMDHTLIRYKTQNFEKLVYQFVVDHLIEKRHYPEAIRHFQFDFDGAIRGLVVDSRHGNILKLSRYTAIRQSYHGTQQILYSEQKKFYRSIYVDLNDPNYMAIDTSFSIAFCVLYSQLVDLKDKQPQDLPDYQVIAHDVLKSVDDVHAAGDLKHYIGQHLDQFVYQDPEVIAGLKRYIRHGKKIFVLTNSDYAYTRTLLDYAITPFLEPGEHWTDVFEYVITLANKPRFFLDDLKFLSIDPHTGYMTNLYGPIKPGIYQGGCAAKFSADLNVKGDDILYIGDHIYGDILRLKKDCNWRTALVVEELGAEISAQQKAAPIEQQIAQCMVTKKRLETDYIQLSTQRIDENTPRYDKKIQALQTQISAIDHEITKHLLTQQQFYNSKWERIFRTGAEESFFAYQVERYACIYMDKLADLLAYSPLTYFRANKRLLTHDVM